MIQFRSLQTSLAMALAITTSFAGCAADGADQDMASDPIDTTPATLGLTLGDESNVVASYDAPDGRQLKFLETEPGVVLVVQAGRHDAHPLITRALETLGTIDLYEVVAGKKAPPALRAAVLRAGGTLESEAEKVSETGLAVTSQALFSDESFFNTTHGCTLNSQEKGTSCRNCTGLRDLQINDTAGVRGGVMNTGETTNLTGDFKTRKWYTWSAGLQYNLKPGFSVTFKPNLPGAKLEFDAKIFVRGGSSPWTACIHGLKDT